MRIRLATLEDIPSLALLVQRVVPLMRATGNLQWDENYPNPEVFARDVQRGQLWVAEISGAIAGVVALSSDPEPDYVQADWDDTEPALVVHRLAVDPQSRGAGVARALMQQAEKVAATQALPVIRVDTNVENQATQRLFPGLGYRFAGEITLRLRPGLRFFCYEKRLPTS
ncbi:GNAT family N-acetyltransferase [Edaphobacter aggregans]|uniref:GNAT family N-acetyltransferase n=1 Tax=Edaphobacter aggregans TaxID=570835 RepID=UPI0005592236|nr:GNAT family N-acetyltransferase [Edaphobacter aggregans]